MFSFTRFGSALQVGIRRLLSSQPSTPPELTIPICKSINSSVRLFVEHGLPGSSLRSLAASRCNSSVLSPSDVSSLVKRWQKMMEAFFGAQVHVLAGLGFAQNEQGLQQYNAALGRAMQRCGPEEQEELRIMSRDLWRKTLRTAFALEDDKDSKGERLDVAKARQMMYTLSTRMTNQDFLSKVSERASKLPTTQDSIPLRHTMLQELLISEVYMNAHGPSGESVVESFGFGKGEAGYVEMQCALAEHQNDPLIAQYVGSAMVKVMESGGITRQAMMDAAAKQ